MKKQLWICETPYQVYNAIKYVLYYKDMFRFDLIINHQFSNSRSISAKIKSYNIFENVYNIDDNDDTIKVSKYHFINRLYNIYHTRKRLEYIFRNTSFDFNYRYDAIFMSLFLTIPITICFNNKPNHIYFYDDGIGSYFGDIKLQRFFRYIVYYLFGKNIFSIYPEALYVNNKKCCFSRISNNIVELPKIADSEVFYSIFSYNQMSKQYNDKMIVYFMHPDFEYNNILIEYLSAKYKDISIIRQHPRDKRVLHSYDDIDVDSENQMWELVCKDVVDENTILISNLSTAQFTPKLLYNKEPYLIFAYNLLKYPKSKTKHNNKFVTRFANFYNAKNKIFVPNSIEVLDNILTSIIIC